MYPEIHGFIIFFIKLAIAGGDTPFSDTPLEIRWLNICPVKSPWYIFSKKKRSIPYDHFLDPMDFPLYFKDCLSIDFPFIPH